MPYRWADCEPNYDQVLCRFQKKSVLVNTIVIAEGLDWDVTTRWQIML